MTLWQQDGQQNNTDAGQQGIHILARIARGYRIGQCFIADPLTKSSAALAKRYLQSLVREFFLVSGKSLHQEILAIEDKICPGV